MTGAVTVARGPPAHARRPKLGPDIRKIMLGIALIAITLWGQPLYGRATASGRLDPALRGAAGSRNVVVILDFMPDRFHNERVQQYGVFAGRDGALILCTGTATARGRGPQSSARSGTRDLLSRLS